MPDDDLIEPDGWKAGQEYPSKVIRAYIDQFADSIYVRVRFGCEWRDLTVKALRDVDAVEALRVTERLVVRGYLPHRVLVV